MDVTLRSVDLGKELNFLEKVVSTKPAVPILANVLIQAGAEGGVKLASTNLEQGLITSCQARVDMPGAITLPVKKLKDIVALLSNEDVRLTRDGSVVKLSSGQYTARLQTLPAEDFPILATMKDLPIRKLPRVPLRDLILKTRFAVTDKDQRYFMNGALLLLTDAAMLMVATDGHRLARAASAYADGPDNSAIVPSTTLDKLVELLQEGTDTDVLFAQSDRHLFFASDGRLLLSRMINGKFPAYERIIPKGQDKRVEVSADALALALQRVGQMAAETSCVSIDLGAGVMDLSSISSTVGDAVERLEVLYDGEALKLAVNGEYVLDFLRTVASETVVLELKSPQDALLFSVGPNYQYIVMPIRA